MDGLSAPTRHAVAFSSPSQTFVGRISFNTAAAKCVYMDQLSSSNLNRLGSSVISRA